MAVLWSALTPRVLLEAPRCSTILAEQALRDAAIELCSCAHIYNHLLPTINVVADEATYDLTSDVAETEVYAVRAAWFDEMPLDFAPLDALNSANPSWRSSTSESPRAFTHREPTKIILWPTPSVALVGGLEVEVALKPTLTSTGLVDWIANRYVEAITAGALERLLLMPGVAWSNPALAMVYGKKFHSDKYQAVVDTNRSLTRGVLSVRMRPAA